MARKRPIDLVDMICDELAKNGPKTTNEIATAIHSNTKTVRTWVDIIEKAQAKPKITVDRGTIITMVRMEKANS